MYIRDKKAFQEFDVLWGNFHLKKIHTGVEVL